MASSGQDLDVIFDSSGSPGIGKLSTISCGAGNKPQAKKVRAYPSIMRNRP
jgi:hypothetical protein